MTDINEKRNIDSMLLALLRTELANRRTLLAYTKTALGTGITALGLLKFSEEQSLFELVGMVMIPLSFIILAFGVVDFMITRKKIKTEKEDAQV